jgi:hypothetical protein
MGFAAVQPLSVPAPAGTLIVDKLITSAQVLALNATLQSLVVAPGTGLANVFEGVAIHKPAGTAYGGIAAGEDLSIKYTNTSGLEVARIETTGFLDQATAQTRFARAFAAASGLNDIVPVANAALVLEMLTGEIITGDSALHVRVYYRVIPAAAFAS